LARRGLRFEGRGRLRTVAEDAVGDQNVEMKPGAGAVAEAVEPDDAARVRWGAWCRAGAGALMLEERFLGGGR